VITHVTAQIDSTNPARLVLNFTGPVNPTISTEPGKLHMVFTRDPLVSPATQSLSFDNRTITQASYAETNGTAELTISGTAPLMATFSNNSRTITVAALSQSMQSAGGAPTGLPPAHRPRPRLRTAIYAITGSSADSSALLTGSGRRFLVVVDPAHGGDERGAALNDKLARKTSPWDLAACCGTNSTFAVSPFCSSATQIRPSLSINAPPPQMRPGE